MLFIFLTTECKYILENVEYVRFQEIKKFIFPFENEKKNILVQFVQELLTQEQKYYNYKFNGKMFKFQRIIIFIRKMEITEKKFIYL